MAQFVGFAQTAQRHRFLTDAQSRGIRQGKMQRQGVLRQLAAGFLHQEFIESFLDLRGSRLCLRRGTRFFCGKQRAAAAGQDQRGCCQRQSDFFQVHVFPSPFDDVGSSSLV